MFNTFLFLFLLRHKKSSPRRLCRFIFLSERLGLCAAGMLDSIGFPMEKSFVGKVESQNIVFKFSAFGESVSNLGICNFQLSGFLLNKSESFSCSPRRFQMSNKSFKALLLYTQNLCLFVGFTDKIAKLNTMAYPRRH